MGLGTLVRLKPSQMDDGENIVMRLEESFTENASAVVNNEFLSPSSSSSPAPHVSNSSHLGNGGNGRLSSEKQLLPSVALVDPHLNDAFPSSLEGTHDDDVPCDPFVTPLLTEVMPLETFSEASPKVDEGAVSCTNGADMIHAAKNGFHGKQLNFPLDPIPTTSTFDSETSFFEQRNIISDSDACLLNSSVVKLNGKYSPTKKQTAFLVSAASGQCSLNNDQQHLKQLEGSMHPHYQESVKADENKLSMSQLVGDVSQAADRRLPTQFSVSSNNSVQFERMSAKAASPQESAESHHRQQPLVINSTPLSPNHYVSMMAPSSPSFRVNHRPQSTFLQSAASQVRRQISVSSAGFYVTSGRKISTPATTTILHQKTRQVTSRGLDTGHSNNVDDPIGVPNEETLNKALDLLHKRPQQHFNKRSKEYAKSKVFTRPDWSFA